jgi:hypothetical protein
MPPVVEIQRSPAVTDFVDLAKVSYVHVAVSQEEGAGVEAQIFLDGWTDPTVVLTGPQAEQFLQVYRDASGQTHPVIPVMPPA